MRLLSFSEPELNAVADACMRRTVECLIAQDLMDEQEALEWLGTHTMISFTKKHDNYNVLQRIIRWAKGEGKDTQYIELQDQELGFHVFQFVPGAYHLPKLEENE